MTLTLDCSGKHYLVSSMQLKSGHLLSEGSYTVDFLCKQEDIFISCSICKNFEENFINCKNSNFYAFPVVTQHIKGVLVDSAFAPFINGEDILLQGNIEGIRATKLFPEYSYEINQEESLVNVKNFTPLDKVISNASIGSVKVWSPRIYTTRKAKGWYWLPVDLANNYNNHNGSVDTSKKYALWSYAVLNSRQFQKEFFNDDFQI